MGAFDFIVEISMLQGLLLIIGLILVIIEMFHPGFGAPGITGGIMLLISVFLIAKTPFQAIILLVIILAILGIALTFVIRSATKGRLSKILILSEAQKKETGYIGTDDLKNFLEKEGIVVTILRPSGTVNFDGIRLDVVSEGPFIPIGTRVKVIKVDGPKMVVQVVE